MFAFFFVTFFAHAKKVSILTQKMDLNPKSLIIFKVLGLNSQNFCVLCRSFWLSLTWIQTVRDRNTVSREKLKWNLQVFKYLFYHSWFTNLTRSHYYLNKPSWLFKPFLNCLIFRYFIYTSTFYSVHCVFLLSAKIIH